MGLTKLAIRGARQHNLKNISVEIPRNTLTVITGLSGSGKSSLAFDTIYAEGQRRSVESLSVYARQFLDQMERPEVDVIEDLSLANWYGAKIQRNVTLLQRLSGHPKPANEKARDIDSDGSPYRLLRYEQCLERSEETTSFGTREARMALAAHRASHWCTSRNSRRLPEGGGDRGTTTGWLGTASTGKTGQRGDHRLWPADFTSDS